MAVSYSVPLPRGKITTGEILDGDKDGLNTIYDTEYNFIWDLGGDNRYFELFRNGQLLSLGDQYVVRISNGVGIGVRVFRPLRPHENLTANFIRT